MAVLVTSIFGLGFGLKECASADNALTCHEVQVGKREPTFWLSGCLARSQRDTRSAITAENDKTEALLLLGAWGVLGMISFARVVKEEGA